MTFDIGLQELLYQEKVHAVVPFKLKQIVRQEIIGIKLRSIIIIISVIIIAYSKYSTLIKILNCHEDP